MMFDCLGVSDSVTVVPSVAKDFCPMVPMEYQDNELYAKPDAKVMVNINDKKVYRAESRAVLKAKKYGGVKDTLEDIAFGDCETENKE